MRTCSAASAHVFAADQIATLRNAQGTRIECASGSLWITQVGDCRGFFFGPGELFTLDRRGAALIEASRQSVALVTEAHAPATRWWQRMASATFFSARGRAYRSEARLCSVPSIEIIALTDFECAQVERSNKG